LRRIAGARRSRRRKRFTVTAVAVAVVVALLALVLPTVVLKGGNSALTSLPEGVDLLNAKTGQLMANIPSAVIRGPDEAHYFGGHLWIKNLTPQSFVEIDPATGRILNQITSPVPPNAFVVDGDTLWVAADNAPVIVKVALVMDFGGREVAR